MKMEEKKAKNAISRVNAHIKMPFPNPDAPPEKKNNKQTTMWNVCMSAAYYAVKFLLIDFDYIRTHSTPCVFFDLPFSRVVFKIIFYCGMCVCICAGRRLCSVPIPAWISIHHVSCVVVFVYNVQHRLFRWSSLIFGCSLLRKSSHYNLVCLELGWRVRVYVWVSVCMNTFLLLLVRFGCELACRNHL